MSETKLRCITPGCCGRVDTGVNEDRTAVVICNKCYARTGRYGTIKEARAAWHSILDAQDAQAKLEKLTSPLVLTGEIRKPGEPLPDMPEGKIEILRDPLEAFQLRQSKELKRLGKLFHAAVEVNKNLSIDLGNAIKEINWLKNWMSSRCPVWGKGMEVAEAQVTGRYWRPEPKAEAKAAIKENAQEWQGLSELLEARTMNDCLAKAVAENPASCTCGEPICCTCGKPLCKEKERRADEIAVDQGLKQSPVDAFKKELAEKTL